ncbi:hypothetical protein EsH8_VIII_000982 [Colletotrichum jinshuiense]
MLPPPTPEQWENQRRLIVHMYTHKTLKAIKAHMKDVHGFNATLRMYKGRLKSWGVEKNKRHNRGSPPERPFQSNAVSQVGFCIAPPRHPANASSRAQKPAPDSSFAPTPPGASPRPNEPDLDPRPAICVATPGPPLLTPATTPRYRSPTASDSGDGYVDPVSLCREIAELATSILAKLVPGRPASAGSDNLVPTDDHIHIYRSLPGALRHESHIRGCLVNSSSAAMKTPISEHVKDMLRHFHPAVPVGILSTINQSSDQKAVGDLINCLVTSSISILQQNHEFTQLVHKLRQLQIITPFDIFQTSIERICDLVHEGVLKVLGRKSLVTIYLIFLLSAKKAKNANEIDYGVWNMAMERNNYVQHYYADEPKLALEFSLFIVGYLILVTPEEKLAKEVLGLAEKCYDRAKRYLKDQKASSTSIKADVKDAELRYGKSCSLLADCVYAQGREDNALCDERRNHARVLLLDSISYHIECSLATMAQAGRLMEKLRRWCEDANDIEKLQELDLMENLITRNEQRPRDGPLLPPKAQG